MMKKELKAEDYIVELDVLLARLSQEIDARLASVSAPSVIQQLDAYIHEVNSFYYESFHKKLVPLYRQNIQEDVSRLLHVSLQEDTLKQGIAANIKRYAQLYNHVKKLSNTLDASKEQTYQQMLTLNRDQDRRSIELSYSLKQWHEHLQILAASIDQLSAILSDQELRSRLGRNPNHLAILQMLDSLDLGQPLTGAGLNSLLSHLRFCSSLVLQMQKEKNSVSGSLPLVREIQARSIEVGREKWPVALQSFYQSCLIERINSYIQPLELYMQTGQHDLYQKNVRLLSQFLEDVLVILERGQHYALAGYKMLFSLSFHGLQVPVEWLNRLEQDLRQTLSKLTTMEEQFSPPGEPDFDYFSEQSRLLLEETHQWMEKSLLSEVLHRMTPVHSDLQQVNFELQYLLRWLDFLKQEAGQRSQLLTALLTVVNTLDAFLNLLGNIRADLERLLAPRNLGRLWKDYIIRVERFPLEKGKPFPPQYLYLLEKHGVEKHAAPLDENMVLLEEGDLFIIRVDDQNEVEVPYLVVSTKG
ncbi:MAG TPA: hypothetical protein VN426_09720 [Syntrophomonadaceae bacterium]|nr:hypothetical protein [Syntrophomonadaceae bacterium]